MMTKDGVKTIRVVAALLRNEEGVLIAKRSTGNPDVLGKWEFPGGKIEPGESEQDALEREIKEEFDMDVSAGNVIAETVFDYPSKHIILKLVECEHVSGEPRLNDHSEYAYISKDEIANYDFAPADIAFLNYV